MMKYLLKLLSGAAFFAALTFASIATEGAVAMEGTVVSSLNTDSYTYVEVSKNDQKAWIVGPLVAVKPGNHVRYEEGAIMSDFYSKQLNRTFPFVMFVQKISVAADK